MIRLAGHIFGLMAMLAVGAPSACAAAPDEKQVELYLQAFYESALWNDGKWPVPVHKWMQPLRVRMTGPMSETYADLVLVHLRQYAALAGLQLEVLAPGDKGENFLVEFLETQELFASGRSAGCVTHWFSSPDGGITNARLLINLRQGIALRPCIAHELMHGMGYSGHPHAIDSVLSYVYKREDLMDVDKMSLRILYDPRMKPNMPQLPAMAVAREVLADKLIADGAPPETREMGRRFMRNLVPLTVDLAEKGNVGLQYQLGLAYTFGQLVDKDEKAGFAWFKRVATTTDRQWRPWQLDGAWMVGYGLSFGRGVPVDPPEGVRWTRWAADRGHTGAQNNLGVAYRDGKGTERDPIEAYKWFALAAGKKYKLAETNLQRLAASLTPSQVDEAKRRVAAWTPTNAP